MKKIGLIAYLVSLHLVLGLLLVNTFFFNPMKLKSPSGISEAQPAPASSPSPEFTEHYYRTLKYHKIMDGSVTSGSMVFIGDSLVQGLWITAISPQSVNYGIGGDTTAGVLKRISEYKSIEHAAMVVIAVGLNDLVFRNNDEIVENYQKIANSIPENIPVVFSAVLPINEDVRKDMQGRNKQIRLLNMKLKKLCDTSRRFNFIDIGAQLIDKNGNLDLSFSDGGGVHLNSKRNEIWISELRKATRHAHKET
jgi:hypothetical protein